MSIIISSKGKNAVKIDKSGFDVENNLQQYIYDNPTAIPLYDTKEDIRLLILAREFATVSGPIDALGIDKEGEIYLIETKLYKNPDKRTVVGQVLDYGASLWSHYSDFDNFINQINQHTQKDFQQNLKQRIYDFYGISEEEIKLLLENAKQNLRQGKFKFVVLMDHLHDQLKDLIIFLNNNSEFTVYAVELEYYRHKEFEILIPRLFGAEVKKDFGKTTIQAIPTDEEFIQAYSGRPEQNQVKNVINLFNDLREDRLKIDNITVNKTWRYFNFQTANVPTNQKISVTLCIKPDYEGGGLQVWGPKETENKIREIIRKIVPEAELMKEMKTTLGKIAKWPLINYSREKLVELLQKLGNFKV